MPEDIFNNVIFFIQFPHFGGLFWFLRFISIIISLIFFAFIITLLLKNTWLKRRFLENITEFFLYRPFGAKKTFKQWIKIIKRLETDSEAEYKLAIIEVDSLLNDILESIGYSGETIMEKLKQLNSTTLPNIEQIREAHKIRNNVVHDPDYHLTLDQAKKTLGIYEQAFRDLEMF